jgi:hypothetical protein
MDKLPRVRHQFKRLSRHLNLFVVEQVPLLHPKDNFVENRVKIFVHVRLIVAQLFALLIKVFAEEILFVLSHNFGCCPRIRIIAQLVLVCLSNTVRFVFILNVCHLKYCP